MVLECPSPCENLVQFIRRHGGSLDEEKTRQIMWQAAHAAYMCCLRRVFHRDVKLENLLINRKTSEVKLIDFGCGDILTSSPYKSYRGMYDRIHFFLIDTEQLCCINANLHIIQTPLSSRHSSVLPSRVLQQGRVLRPAGDSLVSRDCDVHNVVRTFPWWLWPVPATIQ